MPYKINDLTNTFKNLTTAIKRNDTAKEKYPEVSKIKSKFIIKNKESTESEDDEILKHLVERKKSESDKKFIRDALKNNIFCTSLNQREMDSFIDAMSYFVFSVGSTVTKQGTNGSYFFIISEGVFDVFIDDRHVNTIERGMSFGEISLIHDMPRTATIKVRDLKENVKGSSDTIGALWGVKRTVFRETLMNLSNAQYSQNRAILDSVKLFDILTPIQKNVITNAFVDSKFNAGDKIVTQGQRGYVLYIIKEGKADVFINNEKVRSLTNGQYFGERALLYDEPRSATIIATEDTTCVSLSRDILNKVLGNLNTVLFRNLMIEYLQNSTVFRQLPPEQLLRLIESASILDFKPGDLVLHKEEMLRGIRYFIVLEGCLKVFYNDNEIGILERGDSFGEEYIRCPNIAFAHTVKCVNYDKKSDGKCKVAFITKLALVGIFGSDVIDIRLDYNNKMAVIKKMYIFRYLSTNQLDMLIRGFKSVRYNRGDTIFKEGEIGDSFYIINKGEVEIVKGGVHLRTLARNDYFGERALLYDEPRSATVICSRANADVWVVEKSLFLKIVEAPMLSHLEDRIRLQDTKVLFEELETVQVIGNGTFGTVKLVIHKPSQIRFALKCISRKRIAALKQQKHIKLEREIMAQNDHPLIIKLVKTFKDKENIYFLTELITGGELYDAIRRLGLLNKQQAQFYLGSIILAFEYLHERQIAYRDLKPENILLDHQGYIKLIDFGSAKKVTGRAYTLIGTPHYMAPEIILGKGYTCLADIWSFGICLYEFICGPLPFGNDAEDQIEIFRDVLTGDLKFPNYITDPDAIDMIQKFLCRSPEIRLGSSINGYNDIKDHNYFRGFDWEKLSNRALEPPLKPEGENYNKEAEEHLTDSEPPVDTEDTGDSWEQDF